MSIRSAARLAGLVLMVIWASRFIDYAARWISPASYSSASPATHAELSPEEVANEPYTSSASSVYSYNIPSPLSSLPLLCGGILLMWCPRTLVRFLGAEKSGPMNL